MSQITITDDQIIYEIATQLFINKDRIMDMSLQAGQAEFPDPNRQWRDYRDEWSTLSEEDREQWINSATTWIQSWKQKHGAYYSFLQQNGKPVYSIGE